MASHTVSARRYYPQADLSPLEARVTALETPPARVLGAGTPIAGPTATSWTNPITELSDGINAVTGDATIVYGDDWCMCFVLLEGTATDSTGFGDVDVFEIRLDLPTNVTIKQSGATAYDSNMLSGFGSAVDPTLATNMYAPCAVVSGSTGYVLIRGKWLNRVGNTTAQVAVCFLARTETTPAASRHFNGVARQSLAPDAQEAPQITQPENYDYVDAPDQGNPVIGCRIAWCHGVAGPGAWIMSHSAPFSATTSYGASIPVTGWFPAAGTKNQGVIFDHISFTRGNNEVAMNNAVNLTGTAEYRAAFFLPDVNARTPYTSSLSSDGAVAFNTTNGDINYYWRFDQYVFISIALDFTSGTYVDVDVPSLLPVSPGCQIIGLGSSVTNRLAVPWLLSDGVTIRVRNSASGTNYTIVIVYHTSAP